MTLIAFATYGDHAEFITDTASYTRSVTHLGRCTKHLTIPHIDAAVLVQGDSDYGVAVKTGALLTSASVSTFDELVETAPEWLAVLWRDRRETGNGEPCESVAFLIGWSDTEQEFTAYAFASEREFKAHRVNRTWVMPCPWDYRPTALELRRMRRWMHDHPDVDKAAEMWSHCPPVRTPQSVDEWVALAKLARQQRSIRETFARVVVAGDVFHTRLARGEVATRRVHRFNDSGDEFAQMVRWTEHPQALAATCWCDSGATFGECHAKAEQEELATTEADAVARA
jgi:hypothetical protein